MNETNKVPIIDEELLEKNIKRLDRIFSEPDFNTLLAEKAADIRSRFDDQAINQLAITAVEDQPPEAQEELQERILESFRGFRDQLSTETLKELIRGRILSTPPTEELCREAVIEMARGLDHTFSEANLLANAESIRDGVMELKSFLNQDVSEKTKILSREILKKLGLDTKKVEKASARTLTEIFELIIKLFGIGDNFKESSNVQAGDLGTLEKVQAQNQEYLDLLQRLKADFENYRKRVTKDNQRLEKRAWKDVFVELLPVFDSFDEMQRQTSDIDPQLATGLGMISRKLESVMTRFSVEKLNACNREFDPNLHQAVAEEPNEEIEAGFITEVYQEGYLIDDELIRPAMVKVSSGSPIDEECS